LKDDPEVPDEDVTPEYMADHMQGEAFGYLGPNGAGKTTTIALEDRPNPREHRRA